MTTSKARPAENYGFEVVVVSDATATFERTLDGARFDPGTTHRSALAHLAAEFATVATTGRRLDAV